MKKTLGKHHKQKQPRNPRPASLRAEWQSRARSSQTREDK